MIALADAQRIVLEACGALPPVSVNAADALGLVLAADVAAGEDVPPFTNSAVDGFAVVADDTAGATVSTPIELEIVGEVAAGQAPPETPLQRGQAIRIMTGAVVPAGADAVVMVEDTALAGEGLAGDRPAGNGVVRVATSVDAGAAIRPAGSDVVAGDTVFTAGTVVTPPVLGVLASVNARIVHAHPRARVAVLSTGDELVTDGGPLAAGQIRESNLTMLAPLLADAGCEVRSFGVLADDEETLEATLREAAAASDAIVTSGGVSMGDYDVVKAVLGRIADMRWMQVAIKPAKPFAFGLLPGRATGSHRHDRPADRRIPVFGLPGNPVSSLVSFELFARPALRRMMGHAQLSRQSVVAITDAELRRRPDGKTHFLRVVAEWQSDDRLHVKPVAAQGSHQLAATALANAFAVVPDGDSVPAGDEVAVLLL